MKIRTLKKFLKEYKPILEIRLPNTFSEYDKAVFMSNIQKIVQGKYYVLVCQIPESYPKIKFEVKNLATEKLEELRKQCEEVMSQLGIVVTNTSEPEQFYITPIDFVTIHSPFKIPLKLYKKKLDQIKELVKLKVSEK